MIALFDLSGVQFGGWASCTAHTALQLLALGEDARVFRVGARTENKVRPWRNVGYQNLSQLAATEIARGNPSIIMASAKAQAHHAAMLVEAGAAVVFHDPTEKHIADLGARVIVDRIGNKAHHPDAEFVPQAYCRAHRGRHDPVRTVWAVAYSRLDWDKRTATIAEANALVLDKANRVQIYGAENRLYTHHKMPEGWRDDYCGRMPADLWAGVSVASSAQIAVDLSVISGDGGGTQYTHLEAFDAGTALVLHADWKAEGALAEASTSVASAEELAALLGGPAPDTTAAGTEMVEYHSGRDVALRWLELIKS